MPVYNGRFYTYDEDVLMRKLKHLHEDYECGEDAIERYADLAKHHMAPEDSTYDLSRMVELSQMASERPLSRGTPGVDFILPGPPPRREERQQKKRPSRIKTMWRERMKISRIRRIHFKTSWKNSMKKIIPAPKMIQAPDAWEDFDVWELRFW